MQQIVFESQLLHDGHLYCPPQYASSRAKFQVIVSVMEEMADETCEGQSNSKIIEFENFMTRMRYVSPGQKFTRDELNAR